MTAPVEIDAAKVAEGLTKAQREAVLRGEGSSVTVRAVYRIVPALFGRVDWGGGYGCLQFPTDLGIRVRHILEQGARS